MAYQDLIDDFYRAYNTGQAEAAVALYAEDGAHVEAASGQARQGHEALLKGLRGFLGMLDGLRFETSRPVRAGAKVVVPYVMHGVMTRDLGPMQARGQKIALHGVHLFEIAEGRIVQTTDFWDMDDFKAQVAA
ncbi:nuclear transport factor 2 family protein [Frigidibacter sp.]|uniref:nuclear transport factor 2 family protein n=1 Tax=Frigidibacter sp. TaxID=2586418 RepID=UPI0027365DBA|nr:nuclear transport factor 2 family protein [Frigidibacter sp.]MDP3339275.1 nuclear transport factor 2 family protein [Frigidibacter sp.]